MRAHGDRHGTRRSRDIPPGARLRRRRRTMQRWTNGGNYTVRLTKVHVTVALFDRFGVPQRVGRGAARRHADAKIAKQIVRVCRWLRRDRRLWPASLIADWTA